MAHDQSLADRVRRLLSGRTDVTERAMFGGLTFMVNGHMCCGINRDELIVRLAPGDMKAALARRHARPMDFTGRPMSGFVTVGPEGLKGPALRRWVDTAVAHAASRPPKRKETVPR